MVKFPFYCRTGITAAPRVVLRPGAPQVGGDQMIPGSNAPPGGSLTVSQSQVVQIATNPMLQSSQVAEHASTVTTPSLGGAPIITSIQGAPVNPPAANQAVQVPLLGPPVPISQGVRVVMPPTLNNLRPPAPITLQPPGPSTVMVPSQKVH